MPKRSKESYNGLIGSWLGAREASIALWCELREQKALMCCVDMQNQRHEQQRIQNHCSGADRNLLASHTLGLNA